jgi:hypothetical protein
MRSGNRRVGRAVAVVAAALGIAASGAQAAEPLPVPYDGAAAVEGVSKPDTAPGANDWSCKPTVAHPRPVVLVHGLGATLGSNWQTMSPLLTNNGFCVFGLSYGRREGNPNFGGLTRMEESSGELQAFVDRVLRETGAKQVDLLGHSEGTVMPRWYLSFRGGAPKVKRYVQFTPLWQGTNLALTGDLSELGAGVIPGFRPTSEQLFAGSCASCPEFVRGSDYLNKVNAAGPTIGTIEYTGIVTKYDELVTPYTSGILEARNVKNFVLQDLCPTDFSEHAGVAWDPVAGQLLLNALDPARARRVPCTLVLPQGTPNPPAVGLAAETKAASARQCLARRSPIGASNIGRIRVGATRRALLRDVRVTPIGRTRRSYLYCVKGLPGRVTAVFSSRSRKGRVSLVRTTARAHGNRRVRPRSSTTAFRRAYPNARRMARGLYRTGQLSTRLVGVRQGRVRFIAVASPRLLRNPRELQRALRLAASAK